jgi:hypothetical protein
MQTQQGETSGATTQIIVQQPQYVPTYVKDNCPAFTKFFGLQYWPAWAAILGLIGFFCILGGLQSIVSDCEHASSGSDVEDACSIFEETVFFVFYLPNILILLVGFGIACGAHYNQTGWVLKCCLPCAMVGLFIWASVVCYYLSFLNSAINIYCSGDSNYTDDYVCNELKPAVNTTYAGQVLLLIYLVLVTVLGCLYACKYSNKPRSVNNGQPLVIVQTTAPVSQPMYVQNQAPVVYQQGYPAQAQVYPTQGYAPQQGYPPQQGYVQQPYMQQGNYAPQLPQ